jgi:hypothetical protein
VSIVFFKPTSSNFIFKTFSGVFHWLVPNTIKFSVVRASFDKIEELNLNSSNLNFIRVY